MKVALSFPTLCDPMGYTAHGILQARILEWVDFPFSRGSSQPGIEPRSPTLQADSLPTGPQGKPKNTRVGSKFLLWGIFLTQESNRGLLHCMHNYPTFHQLFENVVSHQIQRMSPYYVHATGTEKRILFDLQLGLGRF